MPEKRDDTHQLIERQLVVFKRPTTDVWYCRYKIDEKWYTATTKERDLKKAKTKAHNILLTANILKERNLPVISKKVRDIGRLVIASMNDRQKAGDDLASFEQYKRIINDFIIPILGDKSITQIDAATLKHYEEKRTEKMGKEPAYSTVRKHNVVLNMLFDEAIVRGFMTNVSKPKLETKGRKSENFPTFSIYETNIILAKLPAWIEDAKPAHRELRQALYDYIRVLIDTGARPGKELLDLQWKKIKIEMEVVGNTQFVLDQKEKEWNPESEDQYIELEPINSQYDAEGNVESKVKWRPIVTLHVHGKTKGRDTVGFDMTHKVLTEIADRKFPEMKGNRLRKLTVPSNEQHVFWVDEDKAPTSFIHMFQGFLEDHGLLNDPNTGKKRVLYSFRSLFTTAAMDYDGVDMRDLSKVLGNSPAMIMKHYDRGTLGVLKQKTRAPNARAALFKDVQVVPEEYESAKAKAKAEKKQTKKRISHE